MNTLKFLAFPLLAVLASGCGSTDTSNGQDDTGPLDSVTDDTGTHNASEACNGLDDDSDGFVDEDFDLDGDGFVGSYTDCIAAGLSIDCNDSLATVNPGAEEVCDGIDDNCDGAADDLPDGDGDGFGACQDCDDDDGWVFPGAAEICDGLDNDCDGAVDQIWDGDGDGVAPCMDDCDDDDPTVYPMAKELCDGIDNDCDGLADEEFDIDADGWRTCDGDCDDTNADIRPTQLEICDGLDNDCDPKTDELVDLDGDGLSTCGGDCDDTSVTAYPGGTEVCGDEIDNDCDGGIDDLPGCIYTCTVISPWIVCIDTVTWAVAESACELYGGHLATFGSSAENSEAAAAAASVRSGGFWIGFTDAAVEGSWAWMDGTAVSYTNWSSGEPNDSGGEDCACTNWSSTGNWNDLTCSASEPFICEEA
jgi:hypothetical protein